MTRRARHNWTPEHDALLRAAYGHTDATAADIGAQLGTTRQAVLNRARKLGLQKTKRYWSAEQRATVARLYTTHSAAEIAAIIGRPLGSVYDMAHKLGLSKPSEWIADRARQRLADPNHPARATRFQPGHATWNKGKPHPASGRAIDTQFKPGFMPHTWRPIGTTRRTKDGYLERKVSDTGTTRHDYVAVHHLIWRMHGRPLLEGHAITFRDGNPNNLDINNLEQITRAELMARNTLHRYPRAIVDVIRMRGVLNRTIRTQNQHKGTTP